MGYYLGMKHKIKNLTNSPYALSTVDGALTVPARGEVVAEFDAHQLHAVKAVGYFKVDLVDEDEEPEWSDEVFDRAEIKRGEDIIKPATGTLAKRGRPRKDS